MTTLVLQHGFLGGAAQWRDQRRHFGDGFRVITLELAGFGDRCGEPAAETIPDMARDVLEALDRAGVGRFALLGHSMGGMIAQEIAAMAPDRVEGLVLYGTGPIGALPNRFEPIAQSQARIRAEGTGPTIRRIVSSWFLAGEAAPAFPLCLEMAAGVRPQAALAGLAAMQAWDGRAALARIAAPTRVIWGDRDRSYDWSQPEALWRGITGASLAVLPGCAHAAHLEKPSLFNALLADFLAPG